MSIELDPALMSDIAHKVAHAVGQAIAEEVHDEDQCPELEEGVLRGAVFATLIFFFSGAYLRDGAEIERRFADAVRDLAPIARGLSTGTTARTVEPEPQTETRQ